MAGGGGGRTLTYPARKACGTKANAQTHPAFELVQFQIILFFFFKEKEGFWPVLDERLNLSSISAYPT